MAHESRAGDADSTASAAAAFLASASPRPVADSLLVARTSGVAAVGGGVFTTRRVVNPRYRPPTTGVPGIGPAEHSRLRALDRFRAQVYHQGSPGPSSTTQWEIEGGEQYRDDDAVEVSAAGGYRFGNPELQGLRVSGRHGSLEGSLLDVEPIAVGRAALLHRLRGAVLRYADPRESRWTALGGVPTPMPGLPTPRLALGGMAVENLRFDAADMSANVLGFWRGAPDARSAAALGPDTLPGRGAIGTFAWRAPLAGGHLAGRLGAQMHGLEGHRAMAAQHALEWSYQSPTLVASLSDERGTRRARVLGTDRFSLAPRREDRWNLQQRFASGRAETHLTGVLRDGGELALASRTVQVGASGNLGRSGWYGGTDAVWDWRALTAAEERRLSLYGGGLLAGGHAVLGRLEHAARVGGGDVLTAMGEASLALRRGARLGLEPRFGWNGGQFQQGNFEARLSWPFGGPATRLTGSVTVGAVREEGFRGRVREAALAVSLAPRPRDRGDLEVRRLDQDGRAVMEYSASYDAQMERYETPGQGWFAGRDTGRVTVRVTRTGNGSGAPEILVSLDGKELRFTDADGLVRFDRVPPGVHVIAIEERSLPPNWQVAYASRVFVTVEPGRVPELVRFAIARSERRSKF